MEVKLPYSDKLSTPIVKQKLEFHKNETIDLEKNDKSTKMEKALLHRLINNTSLKSEKKKEAVP